MTHPVHGMGHRLLLRICGGAELMTGGSLADAFKRQRAFGTRRSLEIAADCARGMAYLHNKKPCAIVHRDLKPGNLMIAGSHYYRQCAPTLGMPRAALPCQPCSWSPMTSGLPMLHGSPRPHKG